MDARFEKGTSAARGTFATVGAVSDRGAYSDNGGTTTPRSGPPKILDEVATFHGAKGTFTAKVHVNLQLLALAVATNEGRITILKGTGAYAPLAGAVSTTNLAVVSNSLAPRPPGAPADLPLASQNFVKVFAVFRIP